ALAEQFPQPEPLPQNQRGVDIAERHRLTPTGFRQPDGNQIRGIGSGRRAVLEGPLGGPTPATSLPDTALESRGHFRLAHSSGESLPVGRGEMGKVSQVGDDLLPRTGAGADVLDQLPVTVGLAALLDDRAAEKHGCHPSCEYWLKTIMAKASELINRSNTICHYKCFSGFSEPNCNGCNDGDSKMVELLHLFAENGLTAFSHRGTSKKPPFMA